PKDGTYKIIAYLAFGRPVSQTLKAPASIGAFGRVLHTPPPVFLDQIRICDRAPPSGCWGYEGSPAPALYRFLIQFETGTKPTEIMPETLSPLFKNAIFS